MIYERERPCEHGPSWRVWHTAYQLFVCMTSPTTGNTNISAHEYLSSNISGNLWISQVEYLSLQISQVPISQVRISQVEYLSEYLRSNISHHEYLSEYLRLNISHRQHHEYLRSNISGTFLNISDTNISGSNISAMNISGSNISGDAQISQAQISQLEYLRWIIVCRHSFLCPPPGTVMWQLRRPPQNCHGPCTVGLYPLTWCFSAEKVVLNPHKSNRHPSGTNPGSPEDNFEPVHEEEKFP